MDYKDELKDVIRRVHDLDVEHVETVPVRETFQGQTVWEGEVEVFNVRGHPIAKRCYAWAYEKDGGGKRFIAVLDLPPVDSPVAAVRAAIVSDAKEKSK
jgi:hypothetical protein